jgi:hypothetical protein
LEGRRHHHTVPVRLLRPQNDARKENPDSHFACATNKHLRNLAEMFGSKAVFVLSQDDKARIPLGLPAANKQAPILMHLEYKVRLPDHDWVVAPKHKLIPSVYAALTFDTREKLTYSGPTYIAIRSGKHDSSTAQSHAVDFRSLLQLPAMKCVSCVKDSSSVLPIVIIFSDGGPDENPRYPKTMIQAVNHFKNFDLDCLFISTNASGHSAFNPVERRMAPLSRDLSGLILPHDTYGSHLDEQCRTIDKDLELQNFRKAGETLASVWSENKIDGHDVFAEYISPPNDITLAIASPSEEWKAIHLRQSHYLLQVIKCEDRSCCRAWRTQYKMIFPQRFLLPPLLCHKSSLGFSVCDISCTEKHNHSFEDLPTRILLSNILPSTTEYPILPFDYHCPSQQKDLKDRMCAVCFTSFATKTACNSHKRIHGKKRGRNAALAPQVQVMQNVSAEENGNLSDPDDVEHGVEELNQEDVHEEEPMPIINNIQGWLMPVFEEI